MLPILQAEESHLEAARTAIGSATLTPDDARAVMRQWDTAANGGKRPRAQKATFEQLEAMGIQVVHVPPPASVTTPTETPDGHR